MTAGDRAAAADEIVEAAQGNFLVGQLLAHAFVLGRSVERPFPRNVHQAFERLIALVPEARATHDLLLALAHARGDGLPSELWLQAVRALRRPYEPGDLDELLSGPAASFLVTAIDVADGRRYRLFHQALQETLLRERDIREDNRRLWQAWREALPSGADGAREWKQAPAYLYEHGAEHAAAAERLGELLGDPGYLLFADLSRLASQIATADWPLLHGIAAVVRMAAPQAQPLDPVRRAAMLALAARHTGQSELAEELLAAADPPWRPRWAHSLGHPQQRLSGGHATWVNAVAVGRLDDQDVVASGDGDGVICIWDAAGRPLQRLRTDGEDAVRCLAIGHHHGQDVVIAVAQGHRKGHERIVQLWSADGERCGQCSLGSAFDGDELYIDRLGGQTVVLGVATGYGDELWAWDLDGRRVLRAELDDLNPGAFRIAQLDGRELLAVAAGRRQIPDGVDDYDYEYDNSLDQDPVVGLWDAQGEPLTEFAPASSAYFLATALAAGRLGGRDVVLTSDYRAEIHCWGLDGKRIGEPLRGHRNLVFHVEIARLQGRDVVLSFDKYAARLWDSAGRPIGTAFTSRGSELECGAFGTLGARDVIAAGDHDGAIRLWHLDTEVAANAVEGHEGVIAALAAGTIAGRETVVSGGDEGVVRYWDSDGRPIGEPSTPGSGITGIAIGPPRRAGEIVVSCSSDRVTMPVQVGRLRGFAQVQLWDTRGRPSGCLRHWDRVESFSAVAVGRLGRRLVIAGAAVFSRRVFLWSVRGERLGELEADGPRCIAIGRLGAHDVIAARSGHSVRLWNAKLELCGELSDADRPVDIAIGRWDGQDVLLAVDRDGRIRRWDAEGRRLDDLVSARDGATTCIVLGRLGGRDVLACGTEDGTVRVLEPGITAPETIDALEPVRALAIASTQLYVATGSAVACFSDRASRANGST
jgi:WD40 repeat protein